MSAPVTADDLLAVLGKSRLLETAEIDEYLRRQQAQTALPDTSAGLAELLVRDGILTRFQADNLLKGKWMRFFIGPYKVLEAIGTGGSGVVYLCEHGRMRRKVAVKVLLAEKARDANSLERFNREARAAAALNHPNIVRAFDVGQEDRFHYLVMEYVDGVSLLQTVRSEGPLTATRAADYLRQAALGLGHAHDAGLVHRDVKPSNLMVDREGTVKILDLGLALFADDGGGDLTRGSVLGNAEFMAPEQALDSHAVDPRADIYSLGATIWFCLTGSAPASAGLDFLKRPSRRVRSLQNPADVPDGLWRVLLKMTAHDPADRYQTTSEVVLAVSPWVPDEAARILLVETPPPEERQPIAEDAVAEGIAPQQPAAAAAARAVAPDKKGASRPLSFRPPQWVARHPRLATAILTGLALLGGLLALRTPPRMAVPGRGPGVVPYFKPVSPHSP